MKPSRLAVASLVVFGVTAAGCGGRSSLRARDGGVNATGGRAGDGGLVGPGGSGGSIAPDGAAGAAGTGGTGGSMPIPDGGPRDGGDAGPAVLTGLGVNPSLISAGLNTTVTFRATGRYSDGSTRDLTGAAAWSSSVPSVASMMGSVAITRSAGTTTITAMTGGFSASAALVVTGATLTSLTISPPDLIVPVGMKQVFTAMGLYSDGTRQDLTAQATWTSGDPGIASVSGGVVAGLRSGTTSVVATFQNVAAKASVTVTSARLTALQVSPTGPTLSLPGTQQFTATAIYSDGTRSDVTTQASWASSNQGVIAFAMLPGLGISTGSGMAVVTASLGVFSASTMVVVTAARLVSLEVAPRSATTPVRTTQAFTATGTFADGRTANLTSSVAWSSTDDKIASISNAPGSQGVATGLSPGGVGITATLAGVTGVARLAITEAKVTGLSITPKTVTIGVMAVQKLTATATFSDGSSKDVTEATSWLSADPGIAGVSNSPGSAGQVTGLRVGSTAIVGDYAGFGDKIGVTVSSAVLTSITVSPATLNLVAGLKGNLTATGQYSDGTTLDITAQATWTADDAAVATVSNALGATGLVTGVGAGTTTVRAQLAGKEATAAITVTGAVAQQLSVAPVAATARVGELVQFTASLIRSNGTSMNVTGMATWTSSNPMVAPLGGIGPGGPSRATCQAAGTTTITATFVGLTDSTVLTCTPARTLTDLQVTPFATSLSVGQTVQFQATALYSDGSTQNVTGQTTWMSSNQMVADVRNQGGMGGRGQTTALSAGTATITGTYMGFSASGTVMVTAGTLTGISVAPPILALRVGEVQGLQATAIYSDGTARNVTGMATWTSSNQMVADVTNQGGRGQVTGLADGQTTITATFMGFTATSAVTVTAAKLIEIQVTPFNATLPKGSTVQYQAVGIYSDNTSRSITGMALWDSSTTAAAVSNAMGSRGQVTALAAGTTQISAMLNGVTGETTLTVTAATVSQIQVTPTNPTIPLGLSQPFVATAVYSDFTTQNVTGMATWTSSNTMVAAVSNAGGSRGRATSVGAGTTTISATFMGVTGSSMLTVSAATLKEIQVTPAMATLMAGASSSFVATGVYSDGSMYALTDAATWISTMPGVAAVSNVMRGQVTAISAGTTSIEAHFQGMTGSAALTVIP